MGARRSGSTSCFGLVIVVIRVVFRVLFGGGYGARVLLDLPEIPLPDWVAGIRLLGPVTRESLLAGLYDGMRLATIVICVGAANSLANPKRLLRSMPPALYEIGTALVVAVTVLPQLADSAPAGARRAAAARRCRPAGSAGCAGSSCRCSRTPSSGRCALAAGMDARGYGRSGGASPRRSAGPPAR